MPRRHLLPALSLLTILAPPWGQPRTSAELIEYTWGSLAGSGDYIPWPTNQVIPFTTGDGSLTIGYDADDVYGSYIDVSTGSPGYQTSALLVVQMTVSDAGVSFTAGDGYFGTASVFLAGDPGPLNEYGAPESLTPLLGGRASVYAVGGFHNQFEFSAQTAPEPSTMVLGAIGLGCCAAWARWRRRRMGRTD